jgi:hypothetical protein
MSDTPDNVVADDIVEAVVKGWLTSKDEGELLIAITAFGLTQEQAKMAIVMVQIGYSYAFVTGPEARAIADYDDNPIFKAALKRARTSSVNTPKPESFKPRPVSDLEPDIQSDDLKKRKTAAWELGQTGNAAAIPLLLAALGDGNQDVKIYAIQALSELRSKEAVPALCKYLKEESTRLILSNSLRALAHR